MTRIDVGELITMLDLIIDDEDTPTRQIGHATCMNFDDEGRPLCIAGNLYAELGTTNDQGGGARFWSHQLERNGLTLDAIDFLAYVQRYADGAGMSRRRSWREALNGALERWGLA